MLKFLHTFSVVTPVIRVCLTVWKGSSILVTDFIMGCGFGRGGHFTGKLDLENKGNDPKRLKLSDAEDV